MVFKTKALKSKNKNPGFTIVELLIVIVVIGILAAIIIAAYMGISKKATEAGLQSDLKGAKTQLELYKVEHGVYPTAMNENNCPTTPTPDTNYCINKSIAYTPVGGNGLSYDLVITRNDVSYETTENTPPFVIVPIADIGPITGTPQVGWTLTAGTVTPAGATVTYQWQSATTAGGTYSNISGATSNTLALNPSNIGKYIKVSVSGTGVYVGSKLSVASAQIATDANWLNIGTQNWAKANLNVGTKRTMLSSQTNNAIVEKYCYNDSDSNCTTYGGLYHWDEAMQYSTTEGAQGICPVGSHIPSDNDWKILEMQLGMTQAQADASGWRGTDQGAKLKFGGSTGFNVQMGSAILSDGSIDGSLSTKGILFTSSISSGSNFIYRQFENSNANISRFNRSDKISLSVRCLAN